MDIRKISIGPDYKAAMHYLINQDVMGGTHTIHLIKFYEESSSYKIWITDGEEIVCWKEFINMPLSIEYNTRF
tara:strand:- start:332 stop:550 length:219 start_codon:yes stop_codon:yes gene_type:complete